MKHRTRRKPPRNKATDHPWAEFLAARRRVILWMLNRGDTPIEIARLLSMDPVQVALIAMPDRFTPTEHQVRLARYITRP